VSHATFTRPDLTTFTRLAEEVEANDVEGAKIGHGATRRIGTSAALAG
jgi:hypothetical protein